MKVGFFENLVRVSNFPFSSTFHTHSLDNKKPLKLMTTKECKHPLGNCVVDTSMIRKWGKTLKAISLETNGMDTSSDSQEEMTSKASP
jgi:hypothetical protein